MNTTSEHFNIHDSMTKHFNSTDCLTGEILICQEIHWHFEQLTVSVQATAASIA